MPNNINFAKGIQNNKQVLKSLKNVMKTAGQKYSIKVGIIGEQASQKHPDSDLTNAELGAVHEFGATINVTPKMRAYLHYNGIHLKEETTKIYIPTRSFLRRVLYDKEIQEQIYNSVGLSGDSELDSNVILLKLMQGDDGIIEDIANQIGAKALEMVQTAFYTGGYPEKWAAISSITKKNRKHDKSNPPLQDSGDLMDSLSVEVKKVK